MSFSQRRMNELVWASVSGDELRRTRALESYQKLLIQFNAEEDAQAQARILPVLRNQHQRLLEAGVLAPELEAYFPR